jgi:hypothetical protein
VSSVSAALNASYVHLAGHCGHRLHLERRRDQRPKAVERPRHSTSPPSSSVSGVVADYALADLNPTSRKARNDWRFLLTAFNWRHASAKYIFRTMTMEDYLAVFVHALCSYKQIKAEGLDKLMERLIKLSDSRPEDWNEMMPPSISGLVCNQVGGNDLIF